MDAEVNAVARHYCYALVGKFTKGRPSMALLRKTFKTIDFGGAFTLMTFNQKHVLLHFDSEEDFQRCWMRRSWSMQGFVMCIFKIWIAMDRLPIHLHAKDALFSIANLISTSLEVDSSALA